MQSFLPTLYGNGVAEEVITFEDFTEDIKSHIKECEEEKNVKKEDCLKQWKESKGKELSEGCKCMVKCVGNKADVMDDKGHVIEANLKKHVDKMTDQKKKEMVEKIIEDCKDKDSEIEEFYVKGAYLEIGPF
uniref:Uncharacterized protein n=1 Tax=Timema genevievae TaxID=629358 RepID=A0A7R9JYT2_TIMGE|nr:unnamed protein product [Timema genevievae]